MESIFHRTSVRKFLNKAVEKEKIEKLMRAGMSAPSAGNQQPWEFYIVTNKEKIQQLAMSSPNAKPVGNSPLAIVPCYKKDVIYPEYTEIDLSASVENILLEADSLGLGAVWLGIAPIEERMNNVREILSIPNQLHAFCIIACGYPENIKPQENRYDLKKIHFVE